MDVTMPSGKITSKGQTTIPKEVRDRLSLRAGDTVVYTFEGNRVILHAKNKSVKDIYGMLHRPGQRAVSIEEMDQAIAEGAADFDWSGHKPARKTRRPR